MVQLPYRFIKLCRYIRVLTSMLLPTYLLSIEDFLTKHNFIPFYGRFKAPMSFHIP